MRVTAAIPGHPRQKVNPLCLHKRSRSWRCVKSGPRGRTPGRERGAGMSAKMCTREREAGRAREGARGHHTTASSLCWRVQARQYSARQSPVVRQTTPCVTLHDRRVSVLAADAGAMRCRAAAPPPSARVLRSARCGQRVSSGDPRTSRSRTGCTPPGAAASPGPSRCPSTSCICRQAPPRPRRLRCFPAERRQARRWRCSPPRARASAAHAAPASIPGECRRPAAWRSLGHSGVTSCATRPGPCRAEWFVTMAFQGAGPGGAAGVASARLRRHTWP